MFPSVKTLCQIKDVTPADARQIRAIMAGAAPAVCPACGVTLDSSAPEYCRVYHDGRHRRSRLCAIDKLIGTHGVEYQPAGHNAKSPAFYYCNAGDTYATTILKIRGRFRVGCWGDVIERGRYD